MSQPPLVASCDSDSQAHGGRIAGGEAGAGWRADTDIWSPKPFQNSLFCRAKQHRALGRIIYDILWYFKNLLRKDGLSAALPLFPPTCKPHCCQGDCSEAQTSACPHLTEHQRLLAAFHGVVQFCVRALFDTFTLVLTRSHQFSVELAFARVYGPHQTHVVSRCNSSSFRIFSFQGHTCGVWIFQG